MKSRHIFDWIVLPIFILLAIMNWLEVHWIPGTFYGMIALIYFTPLGKKIANKLRFSIPFPLKIIAAFIILWATLAVGDLAELYGF